MSPLSVKAIDFSYNEFPGDKGTVSQSTFTLSSTTATVFTPISNYEEITLSSSTAVYWYRLDGTTTSLSSVGLPVAAGVEKTLKTIRGKKAAIQSIAGTSDQTIRVLIVDPY